MKDLTVSVPAWYDEDRKGYNEILKNALHREKVEVMIYSKTVKKVAVDAFDNGAENEVYGIYDFDTNVFYRIGDGMPTYRVSGGVSSWNKKYEGSFAYFELPTGHVNTNGEYDETFNLVIDSKMNNAPNLSGKDAFDVTFRTVCDIVHDFLYFEYKGVRYLIDGDYDILAKFPNRLDVLKSGYVDDGTRQFILKDGSKWCLYDIDEKRIVFDDIVAVSNTSKCDFRLGNGDIHIYDKESGRFVLLSKYDTFCDGLYVVKSYMYDYKEDKTDKNDIRDLIYVLKDDKGKFYIRHNNKVVNKNCPFDKVELKTEYFEADNRFICTVGDISDIYDGYDEFRFNTLNIEGGEQGRLWFEKE